MPPSSLRGGAGLGDDAIALCDFDDDTGSASFVDAYFTGVAGLAFVSDLALSANGAHLYTAGTSDSAIGVFSRDPGNGQLAFVEAERNEMGGVSGLDGSLAFSGSWIDNVDGIDGLDSPANVRFSRDGRSLFVASVLDDALAVFSRDAATGGVGFVQVEIDGVLGIWGLGAAD